MDQDEAGLAALVADEQGIEAPAPEPETTPEPEAPQTTEQPAETPAAEETTPSTEPSQETPEPSQTETETPPAIDWSQFIPAPVDVPEPQPDENGQVPIRDVVEYAKAELRRESAIRENVLGQVEQAEQVLPEMKTNPKIAELVRNQALAAAMGGQQPNIVQAAQAVKEIVGTAKLEATNNAQASITVQKNAAVETGASTTPPQSNSKGEKIAERINAGDDDAVVELLDIWAEQGVV